MAEHGKKQNKQQHNKTSAYLSDECRKVLHECFSKVLSLNEVQRDALHQMQKTNGVSPNILLTVHVLCWIHVEQ